MRNEDSSIQNALSFLVRRIAGKNLFSATKVIVIISLLFILLPLPSLAGPLDAYVIGGGGELQCFPPTDNTPCAEVSFTPRLSVFWKTFTKECDQLVNTPDFWVKYQLVAPFLIAPGGGAAFAATYCMENGMEDFGNCFLKGILEYVDRGELKSSVDTLFAIKDVVDFKKSLADLKKTGLDMEMVDNRLKEKLRLEGKDVVETMLGGKDIVVDITQIKDMTQFINEYGGGLAGRVRNRLQMSDEKIKICQFDEAEGLIKNAEDLIKNYCEKAGGEYRWLEKNIRCLQKRHKEWLEKIFASNRPPLEALPLKDRQRLEREMLVIGPNTIKASEEGIAEQEKLFAKWEKDILDNLKSYDEVKNKRKLFKEKKAEFEKRKKEYDAEKDKATSALRNEDLKQVCEILIKIKEMEKNEQQLSPECAQKLCGYRDGKLWGDFLEEALQKNASRLKEDVKNLLEDAKKALKRPCKLDVAREKLTECDRIIEKIRTYSGGKCVNDFDLEREVREAWAQFKSIEQNDEKIRSLLEKAEKLAKNECTFDQALSGETTEENIKRTIKDSCIEEEEVNNRLKRIKRLMEMFKQKAEVEEKAIFNMITSLHELVNPTVPKCDIEGALEKLDEAMKRFKEHLECETTDPGPSDEVRARAERVRAALETSRQFVSSRSSEINQAQRQYRQMVQSLLAKTEDPCHYKETMNPSLKKSLLGWARDFCKPEEANKDIQTIEEAIKTWDERIKKEMEALKQSIAAVEREQNCQTAEELLKKQKENISYLMDCKEYKEPIQKAFDTMESAVSKKKKEADQKVQQALNTGQNALAKCMNLEQALNQLKQVKSAVHESCLSPNLLTKRDNLVEQLEQQIWDIQDRKKGIYVLLGEAEKTLKTCEWDAMESQLSEAKQTLPGEPCFSSQPVFSDLKRRILDLESRKRTKEDKVKWYRARHLIIIRDAKAYLDAKNSGQIWGAALQRDYNKCVGDLQNFIQGTEKEMLADCLYDLIGQAKDMLAQMGGPPRDRMDQASTTFGGPTGDRRDTAPDPCAAWPGSVAILDRNNRVTCICPSEKGLAWNRDKTACIDYRQAAIESTDCSRWPGSIPLWNNQTNRAECFCPQGLAWNRDRTMCIDARQAAVENTDCSRWPGSVPMWNNQTNRVECFCPKGTKWNNNRTACISDVISIQPFPPDQGPCQDLYNRFQASLNSNQFSQARVILEQARNCSFYNQAANILQEANRRYCLQLENEIFQACQAGDKNRAQTLVNQAQAQGCKISPNALKPCQQPPKPPGDPVKQNLAGIFRGGPNPKESYLHRQIEEARREGRYHKFVPPTVTLRIRPDGNGSFDPFSYTYESAGMVNDRPEKFEYNGSRTTKMITWIRSDGGDIKGLSGRASIRVIYQYWWKGPGLRKDQWKDVKTDKTYDEPWWATRQADGSYIMQVGIPFNRNYPNVVEFDIILK